MFIDHAKIYVRAGDGGNGCLAFRREKYVPRGGPSGGNGGAGGDVYFCATTHLNTLLPLKYRQHFRGGRGGHGSGNNRHGKNGNDIVIEVPVGTQIRDESNGQFLFDLDKQGQTVLAAKGGKGGRGNAAFATSVRQAPRRFEEGKPGEARTLSLELKVLADVGLVGYPNAGKSTLISVISAAKPKIADYPFTTLTPNLGVVINGNHESFVVADIPGLIEGAHKGSGLGSQFLRHVERTRLLVHLIDVSDSGEEDPVHALISLRKELEHYNTSVAEKSQIIAASKLDAANPSKLKRLRSYCRKRKLPFEGISSITGEGLAQLRETVLRHLKGKDD